MKRADLQRALQAFLHDPRAHLIAVLLDMPDSAIPELSASMASIKNSWEDIEAVRAQMRVREGDKDQRE